MVQHAIAGGVGLYPEPRECWLRLGSGSVAKGAVCQIDVRDGLTATHFRPGDPNAPVASATSITAAGKPGPYAIALEAVSVVGTLFRAMLSGYCDFAKIGRVGATTEIKTGSFLYPYNAKAYLTANAPTQPTTLATAHRRPAAVAIYVGDDTGTLAGTTTGTGVGAVYFDGIHGFHTYIPMGTSVIAAPTKASTGTSMALSTVNQLTKVIAQLKLVGILPTSS